MESFSVSTSRSCAPLRSTRTVWNPEMGSKVTLGIPLHNSAPFLDELFTCLRGLDPAPAEIIFLDDASNDDSAARVDGFLASGAVAGARLVRSERNLGIAGAYNRLAQEASSEWIQVLD